MKKLFVLAALCAAMPLCAQQPQTQTAPVSAINAKYVNGVAPGYAPTAGSGLTLNLSAGTADCLGTIVTYAGGTLTMNASATSYVYLDTSASCAPAVTTTAFTSSDIPIAQVVAGASAISSISDVRTLFARQSADVSGGFQNYVSDPLGTQSVVVPFTAVVNNLDGGSPCFATSNTTSGQLGFAGTGSNLGCAGPPGPSITWSAAALPAYVLPANVTAIYAVGTVGYSGRSQALNVRCHDPAPNSTTLMDGGTLDGSPDTGVLTPYSAQLTWATGASIGTISCVANVASNEGGASNPSMNIPSVGLLIYYIGTAPPASTALNVTSPLYLNSALNALGVAAINLGASGDGGVIGTLPVANGGTNGTTAAAALSNLLGNPAAGTYSVVCSSTSSCAPSANSPAYITSLTTAGTGGPAAVNSGVLNIPVYASANSQVMKITSGICTANGSSYATCGMTQVNWATSFGSSSSYGVVCTGMGPSNGTGAAGSISGDIYDVVKSADGVGITIKLETNTSSGFSYSEIDCEGKPLS